MSYNLTNISNATDPGSLIIAINDATDGIPGVAILLIVFFGSLVLLTRVRRDSFTDAFTASSFITTVVAMILLGIGLIGVELTLAPVGLLIAGLLIRSFGG